MRGVVLYELYRQDGSFISGETLATKLGISRVAVWKHIAALKEEGYNIIAVTGKGYCLADCKNIVLPDLLKKYLKTDFMAHEYYYYPCLDSTNNMAYRLVKQGNPSAGTVVAAGEQTGGKGRRGHGWESPQGGLWFSVILKPALPMQQTAVLSLVCAVAVCRALRGIIKNATAEIKWPNDIMIRGRKIAGILLQTAGEIDAAAYVIAGIGVNSNVEIDNLADELKLRATSLLAENGVAVDNTLLLATVLGSLEESYQCFLQEGFQPLLQEFKEYCAHLGKNVQVDTGNGLIQGINCDIDDYGSLIIDTGESKVRITTGDVYLVGRQGE
ncbi:MAG TPA: biotin--[acetyl-CoA-carboxylase] ligase [Syntrophomonadaceae bacterium]|nr:biotin--[acetyl-CoA-carboxylase] ligase [Syntrophomonadaceae bacterium]